MKPRNQPGHVERVFDFVGLIRRAPRTVNELTDLMECHRNTVETYVALALGEGLIQHAGHRTPDPPRSGRQDIVYRWVELGSTPAVATATSAATSAAGGTVATPLTQ